MNAKLKNEPYWIVNDLGELGVKVGNRYFFLYKGGNIEYEDNKHEDGTFMFYRKVGKREFGETCKPDAYWEEGYNKTGRYTKKLSWIPGLTYADPGSGTWQILPTKKNTNKIINPAKTLLINILKLCKINLC